MPARFIGIYYLVMLCNLFLLFTCDFEYLCGKFVFLRVKERIMIKSQEKLSLISSLYVILERFVDFTFGNVGPKLGRLSLSLS